MKKDGRVRRRDIESTHLVVECGPYLFAFRTGSLDRAVLSEGIAVVRSPHDLTKPGEAPQCPPVAEIAGQTWVAWDMGLLVRHETARKAWLLFQLPYEGQQLSLALRVGSCVAVAEIRERHPLPPGILAKRSGAFQACFWVSPELGLGAAHESRLGLCVDVRRLFTPQEMMASKTALGLSSLHAAASVAI